MLVNVVLPNNMTNTSGLLSYNELITYIRIKVGDRFYDYKVKQKKCKRFDRNSTKNFILVFRGFVHKSAYNDDFKF